MSGAALALQKAFVAAIQAASTEVGNNVFDHVPGGEAPNADVGPFPRVVWAGSQSVPNNTDCYRGSQTTIDLDVYSRSVGFPQAQRIADDVRAILDDAELVLDGHSLQQLEYVTDFQVKEQDGRTRRVRLVFEALTQPEDGSGT